MDINHAIQIAGETALSMYSAMPVKIALLVVALLFCFAGFKLLRGVTALLGVVLGVACGTCVPGLFQSSMTPFMEMILTILGMVVLGIVCGMICFKFYQLGVFLVFAVVGIAVVYVPALFVAERSMAAFWVILAVGALLFGATGVLFLRPVSIFITSCFGFAAAFPIMDLLQQQIGEQPLWMTIAVGAVLSVLGFVVQLLTNRQAEAHPFGIEDVDDEDDDEIEEAVPVAAQTGEQDGVSDSTQVLDMSELPQEEPDEIDTISDAIAARIGLAEPETHPLTEEDVRQMTQLMEETETQPLTQETAETAPVEQEEQETVLLEPDTEPQPEPEQAQPDADAQPQQADEPEEPTEAIPEEEVDPVTRLLDAMRPQTQRITVPVEEEPEKESALYDEPTIGFDRVQSAAVNDEPTVVFEPVEETEPDSEPEPVEQESEPDEIGNEPTQLLDETEEPASEQATESADEQPEELDAQPTQVIEPAAYVEIDSEPAQAEEQPSEPDEIGNEPTQLLDEIEEPAPEQEPEIVDEQPEELDAQAIQPKKRRNPLCIVPALLLAIGALAVATVGFQYVEIVLALGFACYLLKWYRTAAFACAILCVRRAVDAVMLYMQNGASALGLNQTTLAFGLDIVSCLVLLWLTVVAVHSYTKANQEDADDEED